MPDLRYLSRQSISFSAATKNSQVQINYIVLGAKKKLSAIHVIPNIGMHRRDSKREREKREREREREGGGEGRGRERGKRKREIEIEREEGERQKRIMRGKERD